MALQEGRIWRLRYRDCLHQPGWRCDRCSALWAKEETACAYCGSILSSVEVVIEVLAERVAESGGKVESVQGEAAQQLDSAGGIGAQLWC